MPQKAGFLDAKPGGTRSPGLSETGLFFVTPPSCGIFFVCLFLLLLLFFWLQGTKTCCRLSERSFQMHSYLCGLQL